MKKRLTQMLTAMLFVICCWAPLLLQAAEIQHSFFVAGPDFTGIVGEDGKPKCDSGRAGARVSCGRVGCLASRRVACLDPS